MFSQFYGIQEQPFTALTDPRYFYASSVHLNTLEALAENLRQGHRLQVLTAPPGLGKSSLLQMLLAQLGDTVQPAFVFYTLSTATEMFGLLLAELGLADPGKALTARREALRQFLANRSSNAPPVLGVIDEAQNLDADTLDEFGFLLAQTPPTFRLILSGQPELTEAIHSSKVLASRVAARHELSPLGLAEVTNYIRSRLRVAGYFGPELFTQEAVEFISRESSGIPRDINTLCHHALEYGSRTHQIPIDQLLLEHAVSRASAFRNTVEALLEEAGEAEPATPFSHSQSAIDQSSPLADVLRNWLSDHWGVWSGTAAELQRELRAHWDDFLPASSASELGEDIARNAQTLLRSGVQVELRNRPGQPQRLTLRLLQNNVKASRVG